MEQTFNDLYRERRTQRGLFGSIFWMFAQTGVGIIKEQTISLP